MIERQAMTGELQFDLSADDQGLFLAEVDELLQRVEESLVDLERAPDDEALLNEIERRHNLFPDIDYRVYS